MRVALVHDDLVQWGGAERMLVALSDIFPQAPIYTLVYDSNNPLIYENFHKKKIVTSFLQKIPGWKSFYRMSLPLHPVAFEQFDFSEFDLVISQTTRFAKGIITKPGTLHICYCHTPPRFLYNFSGTKVSRLLGGYLSFLKIYDQISAKRVDYWLAGSKNAQERIAKIYGQKSNVLYPFVDPKRFSGVESFDGGYFLVISRLNDYKRVDLAIRAAQKTRVPLKVVGVGPQLGALQKIAGPETEFLGLVDETTLNLLLAGCKALIICAEEDFGLTSLEAQVLGKPVVAFSGGGARETVIEGETGYLFQQQTVESLIEALQKLLKNGYKQSLRPDDLKQSLKTSFLAKLSNFVYNKERCASQASRFSREVFTANLKKFINSI